METALVNRRKVVRMSDSQRCVISMVSTLSWWRVSGCMGTGGVDITDGGVAIGIASIEGGIVGGITSLGYISGNGGGSSA